MVIGWGPFPKWRETKVEPWPAIWFVVLFCVVNARDANEGLCNRFWGCWGGIGDIGVGWLVVDDEGLAGLGGSDKMLAGGSRRSGNK